MMDGVDVVATFERQRSTLFGIAYRMLGQRASAEDVVQEAFLKWQNMGVEVASPRAWLSKIVVRLCLDELKSARVRRETYVGPWLPEPLATAVTNPVDAESLSLAFLVMLETLGPAERAAYLLHEVFDYSHAEVADILGQTDAACRQLVHRARAHVAARRPRFAPTAEQHRALLGRFLYAVTSGDLAGLEQMLATDAVSLSDGGGKVNAALNPVHGASAIARLFIGLVKKFPPSERTTYAIAEMNGLPALVAREEGRAKMVLAIETDGARVYSVQVVLNPDKLAGV